MKAISLFMAVLIVVTAVGCASAQPSAEAANRMQMDELIALSKQGLSDDELIAQVEQRGVAFVLSPGNFDQQRSAGVSEGCFVTCRGVPAASQGSRGSCRMRGIRSRLTTALLTSATRILDRMVDCTTMGCTTMRCATMRCATMGCTWAGTLGIIGSYITVVSMADITDR